jgi:hypothetical protein
MAESEDDSIPGITVAESEPASEGEGASIPVYHGRGFGDAGPGSVDRPDGSALPPRNDLRNHSPDGFQIGYGGSGPAQLALALLADRTDDSTALDHHQEFKWDVIAELEREEWILAAGFVDDWLDAYATDL